MKPSISLFSTLLLLTALLAAGCNLAGSSTSNPAGQPPAPAVAMVTIVPPETPLDEIKDIAFINPVQGWLLGAACSSEANCQPALRYTADGGLLWQEIPAPETTIAPAGELQGRGIRQLAFLNSKQGWAYGPGLYATLDGGQTWTSIATEAPVLDLQPGAETVWVLTGECSSPDACTFTLLDLDPESQVLSRLDPQPPVRGPRVQMERLGDRSAWILSWGSAAEANQPALIVSHTSGRNWLSAHSPCAAAETSTDRIAIVDQQRLWMVCGGDAQNDQQLKTFHMSNDGGQTWAVWGRLTKGGYLDDLIAISFTRGFLGLGRSTLLETQDTGQSWNPVLLIESANPEGVRGWRLFFVDGQHGWASVGSRLFRTVNGGDVWEAVEVQ